MDHVSQSDGRRTELLDFGMQLNDNIASGDCDPYLRVADRDGSYPIVAALGSEPVSRLTEVAMHGYAWRCRTVHGARKRRFFIPITAPIPHNQAFPYIIVRIVADHGTTG